MTRRPVKPTPTHRPAAGPLRTVPGGLRTIRRRLVLIAAGVAAVAALSWVAVGPEPPARLRARAEAGARAGDWDAALGAWRALNRTTHADSQSHLGEARVLLELGRAAQAERALERASAARPADPQPWRLRLELLRAEDRSWDAQEISWAAYEAVPPSERRDVLRALTLALLADPPDDLARRILRRWVAADPADLDARVALLRRIAARPLADDPDLPTRIATLTDLLARAPNHVAAREALVVALADAGEPDRGRSVLDAWPASLRDARYSRLRGRWDLDYDHQPARAVGSLGRALLDLPHDWQTRYRLARALQALGRTDEARREAQAVARLRELLDPIALGQRLEADLARFDDPASRLDLAGLCAQAGLTRLADAWRRDTTTGEISPQRAQRTRRGRPRGVTGLFDGPGLSPVSREEDDRLGPGGG
jgi:thioredoxin-like negative regulator of GroEL